MSTRHAGKVSARVCKTYLIEVVLLLLLSSIGIGVAVSILLPCLKCGGVVWTSELSAETILDKVWERSTPFLLEE